MASLGGKRQCRVWLAVGAGARWLTKRWPPAHFAELVHRAQDRFGGSALLIGSTEERQLAGETAQRLAGPCRVFAGETRPLLGAVEISLYRDDVFHGLPKPEIGPTELPEPVDGKTIVLVDDVLFTGRTVRAAMDVLADYGRPRSV